MKTEKWHTVNVKIQSNLHRALRLRAAREDKKLQEVFREAVAYYVNGPTAAAGERS